MKNKIFYFLTLILLTTLTSCEENVKPTDIEFVTFSENSKSFVIDKGTTLDTEFKIYTANKVASATNVNITVTGSIAAANYSIPGSVTIPANSNEATFSISITENNLDKINGETLSLTMAGPDGFYNGESLDLIINVFCPSPIEGSYTYSNGKPATITASAGINNFVLSGDNAFTSDYPIYLNDQCGAISFTGSFLIDAYDIATNGGGNLMDDGTIVLTYTADGYFENRTMTLNKN